MPTKPRPAPALATPNLGSSTRPVKHRTVCATTLLTQAVSGAFDRDADPFHAAA